MKTEKEVVQDLVEIVFEALSGHTSANMLMLKPAINIAKLKLSQMTDAESANLVDQVHRISRHIEMETGKLSPYHGIEPISENA